MNLKNTFAILLAGLVINMTLIPGVALSLNNYHATIRGFNQSGIPTPLTVGDTYTFTASIHVNSRPPKPINSDGVWDVFGLSWDRINSSQGKVLDNPNDPSVTVQFLQNGRPNNDSQQAYSSNGDPMPSGVTRWDNFQCGEIWPKTMNDGDNFTISCKFTPKKPGFYQVDISSYYYYATYIQKCYQGWCGPVGGYFIRVVNPVVPTPTPKPTATPTPTNAPTATPTPTASPTPTGAPTATPTPTSAPTATPTATPSPTPVTTVQAPPPTTQAPKTGASDLVYGLITLLPLGWKLRKMA